VGAEATETAVHYPRVLFKNFELAGMSIGSDVKPWLSVIMPSHCGERWIDLSLRSIVAEAADGIEILVVDSADSSAARDIAQKHSDRLHIRIFERRDLPSWHSKTNFGARIAESEHICWLGVDDLWLPGRAAAVRAWLAAFPETPLHFAPSAIIDKDGRELGVWHCPFPAERALESDFVIERLLVQNFMAAPAPVFRKNAWLSCGGLDESLWYTADWDMWLKLAARGPTCYHDDVTVGFRIHSGSLTVTGSGKAEDFKHQMEAVLERHLSGLGSHSKRVERAARVSIDMNAGLAAASRGDFAELFRAATRLALLGPGGMRRYLRDSRIVERVLPRVRATLTSRF
jgi:glycosyltransferase involved in cell wall biosynthesis